MMSGSKETPVHYKYNVKPELKRDYFTDDLWMLLEKGEAGKPGYVWKENDIVICSHHRSGTHMAWNLIRYLLNRNTERLSDAMTESCYPPYLDDCPQVRNPRVLYSHLLPCEYSTYDILKSGNRKFIYMVRNPNDCAVSCHHFWMDLKGTQCPKEFPVFYNEFITGTTNTLPGCGWYNHVKAWEEYAGKNPDICIMFLIYEDLVRKTKESLRVIAQFLDVEVSEDLLEELAEASKFDNMKRNKVDAAFSDEIAGDANDSIYRKGVIGDWKNYLTVKNYELFKTSFPEHSADMICKDKLVFT